MALAGTLRDFSLADIFQLIGLQKKTGILTLTNSQEEARITFLDGMVVGADTNAKRLENHLGHVLVKSKRITQEELDEVLTIQTKTLQRLGQILVDKGFLKPDDLRESLHIQSLQIIYRLFRWTDGEYHFQQKKYIDYDKEFFEPITSESILMEGVRMVDEWPMIEKVIPNFDVLVERTARGRAIKVTTDQDFSLDGSGGESFNTLLQDVMEDGSDEEESDLTDLEDYEEQILALIDGPSVVQDIIDRSGLSEFETCRALYDLMGKGLIQRVSDVDVAASPKLAEERSELPPWMVAILLSILALISFALSWNPLNSAFAGPAHHLTDTQQYEATAKHRLNRVTLAIDLYFLKKNTLPSSLSALVREGLLDDTQTRDPRNRPLTYHLSTDMPRYTLQAYAYDGNQMPEQLTRSKMYQSQPTSARP